MIPPKYTYIVQAGEAMTDVVKAYHPSPGHPDYKPCEPPKIVSCNIKRFILVSSAITSEDTQIWDDKSPEFDAAFEEFKNKGGM